MRKITNKHKIKSHSMKKNTTQLLIQIIGNSDTFVLILKKNSSNFNRIFVS